MRVINKHLKFALCRDHLEPARNLRRFTEAENCFAQVEAERVRCGQRRHRVGDVEPADQRQAHEITFAPRVELIRCAAKFHAVI